MNNFIGKDNFVWWVGVVEDNKDPLFLGRCKIRIFGWHTDNTKLIPTAELPWAMPLMPVNNSRSLSVPLEGDYTFGFFSDGMSAQAPVFMGVFPAVPQNEPSVGAGFTSLAKYSNSGDEALQAFEDAQQAKTDAEYAALATQEGSAFIVPAPPVAAPAMKFVRIGKPTTPTNAYSANDTMISVTNNQLVHACDFRFLIDFPNLDIGVIQNPITLIEQSIKNAKNKAAAIIRTALAQIIDKFRLVLKGITVALNLDPTGQVAKIVTKAREIVRTINYYSKKLAEIVGQVALVIALITELKQIVEWIKSLPEQILAILKDCLLNFQNAIQSAGQQFSLIPGQVSGSLENAFKDLEISTSETISQAQQAEQSANVPSEIINVVNSPDTANANALIQFITTQFPNANVIITSTNEASFNVANSSTP